MVNSRFYDTPVDVNILSTYPSYSLGASSVTPDFPIRFFFSTEKL